jgi:leucyl/phenylalanyl-tRNA---protein transferase
MLAQLEAWGMPLVDCQVPTSHLASLGAREIPRSEFMAHVRLLVRQPPVPSPWRFYNGEG